MPFFLEKGSCIQGWGVCDSKSSDTSRTVSLTHFKYVHQIPVWVIFLMFSLAHKVFMKGMQRFNVQGL